MQTLLDDIEFLMPETYKALNKKFELKKFYLKTEKEQITESFNQGMNSVEYFLPTNTISESEQYYKETFGDNPEAGI